ncbi:MAG: hypothetical protein R2825_03975 [Saprospiraceae bacterium]
MKLTKILITAAGSGGTNALLNTLHDDSYQFVGTNIDRFKAACSVTKRSYLVPRATDEEDYIETINKIIAIEKPALLIPNSDIEAEILAKHRDRIKTRTFLPSYEVIVLCQDKFKMYEYCRKKKVHVAKTISLKKMSDLDTLPEHFSGFPLWARIRTGAGSKHTSKIFSVEHAKQFISHKTTAYKIKISDFTISEYLPGNDYAVMTLWKEGELVLIKMAHRAQYFGQQGESPPSVIKCTYSQKIVDFAIDAVKKFNPGANGVYNLDIKIDKNNNIALTEVNIGRFYYNMPIFNLTGKHNAFQVFLKCALGKEHGYGLNDWEEKIFIREMDNRPYIFTEEEINQRVISL